jgi:hypothetical protein
MQILERLQPFLSHIREIVCQGCDEKSSWFIKWMAHIYQKPWIKTEVVPVLIGEPGCGKGKQHCALVLSMQALITNY